MPINLDGTYKIPGGFICLVSFALGLFFGGLLLLGLFLLVGVGEMRDGCAGGEGVDAMDPRVLMQNFWQGVRNLCVSVSGLRA